MAWLMLLAASALTELACPEYIGGQFFDLPSLYSSQADYSITLGSEQLFFNLINPTLTNSCTIGPETIITLAEPVPFKSSIRLGKKSPTGCVVLEPYLSTSACNYSLVERMDGGLNTYLSTNLSKDYELWLTCGTSISLSSVSFSNYNATQKTAIKLSSPAVCSSTLPPYAHIGFSSILVAICFFAAGLFLMVWGQRYLRISIFVSASVLLYVVLASALVVRESNSPAVYTIILLMISLQFALVMLLNPRLGVTAIALLSMLVVSFLLQAAVLYLTGTMLGFYIIVGVVALVAGLAVLYKAQHSFISFCAALSGAYLFIRPLGFWFGNYPPQFQVYPTNYTFYFFMASILVLTGVGIAIQCWVYKKHKKELQKDKLFREVERPYQLQLIAPIKNLKNIFKKGESQEPGLNESLFSDLEEQPKKQGSRRQQATKEVHKKKQYQMKDWSEMEWE